VSEVLLVPGAFGLLALVGLGPAAAAVYLAVVLRRGRDGGA
jgi:hypothetical protein